MERHILLRSANIKALKQVATALAQSAQNRRAINIFGDGLLAKLVGNVVDRGNHRTVDGVAEHALGKVPSILR